MWDTETFKTKPELEAWVEENDSSMQWEQIFVNNAYGVIYRPLYVIDFGED